LLQNFIPVLAKIPTKRNREIAGSMSAMRRIGARLISAKKAALLEQTKSDSTDGLQKNDVRSRNLLTLLIKSNTAFAASEARSMSEEEISGQIPTFIIAGHETTSSTTTWCLYALSKHPEIQKKLREELMQEPEAPTYQQLDALPYLDAVVRETLRVFPVVTGTAREATKDDLIPLSKPITDQFGNILNHVKIQKGDSIFIPIKEVNLSKDIWGEDAAEFKPERWSSLPDSVKDIPGVWGNLMSFIGGPRSCIGYKFAIIEMKALLYTLVRAIHFEIDPKLEISAKTTIVSRPRVKSEPEKGSQLPLICTAVIR